MDLELEYRTPSWSYINLTTKYDTMFPLRPDAYARSIVFLAAIYFYEECGEEDVTLTSIVLAW